jgi:DNA modification methylase
MPLEDDSGTYDLAHNEDDLLAEAEDLEYTLPSVPAEVESIGEADGTNWRDFPDVATNSLWIIGSRSQAGMHNGEYHGNFVPQIPYQAIRRFTKPEDIVLDPFLGSGTTLIECRRQGRHGIGIELTESIAQAAQERIEAEANPHDVWFNVITGDSTEEDTHRQVRGVLEEHERSQVQLIIMHPPYHDIISFSDDEKDLSNASTLRDFLDSFGKVVRGTYGLLQRNHFLIVVIGDKYSNREWVPLGFHTMQVVQSAGYTLKSIVVKNMEGNRAKRRLANLWRQRAFKGKYYIFKHEYLFFFQKTDFIENLRKVVECVRMLDDREELNLIRESSFVSGEELGDLVTDCSWISPSKVLALKHRQIRAVVVDLTGVEITRDVEVELENLISVLPGKVVDVSLLTEWNDDDKRARLAGVAGVSHVYPNTQQSIEQLAHALYVVRKAMGSGQRIGRAAGVAFANRLSAALEEFFEPGVDYERPRGRAIDFRFFKRDVEEPFELEGSEGESILNFKVGIETKWISGHETEKLPQIRDRYFNTNFKLVAVVGYRVETWRNAIEKLGNFADYYLFVDKKSERALEQIIQNEPLVEAVGDSGLEEISQSLVEFLQGRKS